MVSETRVKILYLKLTSVLILILTCSIIFTLIFDDFYYGSKTKCVDYSKIKSIDSISYRSGFVTLENGEKKQISIGVVGDSVCVKTISRKFLNSFND